MGTQVSRRRDDEEFATTIAHPSGTDGDMKTSFQKDTKLLQRTHLKSMEFKLMQHRFKSYCRSCFSDAAMRNIVSEYSDHLYLTPIECRDLFFNKPDLNDSELYLLDRIFNTVNINRDSVLSFGEYIISVSIAARGDLDEKLKGSFFFYDVNGDGVLNKTAFTTLVLHLLLTGTFRHDRLETPEVPMLPQNASLASMAQNAPVMTAESPGSITSENNGSEQVITVAPPPTESAPVVVQQIEAVTVLPPPQIAVTEVGTSSEAQTEIITIDDGEPQQAVVVQPVVQQPVITTQPVVVVPSPAPQVTPLAKIDVTSDLGESNRIQIASEIANQMADELFGNQETLSREQFEAVCRLDDRWLGGFGAFKRFLASHLECVTLFLTSSNLFERQGYLRFGGRLYYHELKGGVLIRYKEDNKEEVDKVQDLRSCIGVEDTFSDLCGFNLVVDKTTKRYYIADSAQEKTQWVFCILLYILASTDNRYNSFAPVRLNSRMRWYVDGKEAFSAMAKAMYNATEEIFIAGWAVTPLYYMLRGPHPSTDDFRLDVILKHKAAQGVRIYIMVWKETTLAGMYLETTKVKHYLKSLYPRNIYVCTHPKKFPLEWSHHQKIVCVDQTVGFVGGLDIAYGRWDDFEHRITDTNHCAMTWPGNDYTCTWRQGFLKFDQKLDAFRDPIDREYYPRQAWHDVHCSCEGEAVQDICTNFIERWNHHTRAQDTNNRLVVKMPNSFFQAQQGENLWKRMRSHFGAERKERKERERTERKEKRDKRKHKVDKKENRTPMEMWNDLSTKIHRQFEPQTIFSAHKGPKSTQEGEGHTRSKTIDESKLYAASELPQVNPEKISTKMLNGFKTFRMGRGKHKDEDDNSDEMNNPALSHRSNLSAIFGDKRSLSGDVDQQNKGAFRRNSADSPVSAVETDFHKYSASIADGGRRRGSLISPRSARTQSLIRNDKMEGILNAEAERKSRARDKWYKQGQEEGFTCDVQVVRSISKWSGSTATEQSIYAAYVDLITKAKHFIYIENQYFIGSTAGGQVRNVVAQMILNRLITAITNQETFRVIIVVPVLPDGDPSDASIQQVIKWQYRTIINSKGSILNTLRETFPKANLEDYISFYCLRSHGMLNNEFYIHEHDEQVESHEQREKSKGKTNLNGLADIKTSGDKDENEDDEAENRNAMNVKSQKRIFTDTGKRVVTEQIYVHSKLMIVDDRVCVIGSANINDRSMLGNRDSEICAIIEDKDFVWSKMNGQSYRAGKFALSLRLRLWKEHLGLLKKKHSSWENDPTEFEEVSGHTMNDPSVYKLDKEMNASKRRQIKKALMDPIVDSTYKIWIDTAKANTAIYESVFPNIVSNKYPTVEAYLEERDRYNPLIEIEKKRREELERERWKYYRDMKKQEGSSAEINLLCETPCEEKEERISTESKMPDDQILNTYGQSVERKISSADFRKEQLLKRIELSKLRGNLCMYPLEFAKYDTFKKTLSLNLVDDSIFT